MATKVPLVMGADGHPQQLQSTDQISASMAVSDTRLLKSGEASVTLVICAPVYVAAAGVLRGQANAKSTADVIGLVYDAAGIAPGAVGNICVGGIMPASTAQWDAVTGGSGGLAAGTDYFLDPAASGKLTTTPPATIGLVNTFVGKALSSTDMDVTIRKPILL